METSPTQDLLKSNVQTMVLEIVLCGGITSKTNLKMFLQYCSKHSWIPLKNKLYTTVWSTGTPSQRIKGGGTVPGPNRDKNSYIEEVLRLLG